VLACILILPFSGRKPSPKEIESMARDMGMIYEDEVRAISGGKEGEVSR